MILITGGLGFIGSHIALHLLSKGQQVVLVDNLVNSHLHTLDRLQYIARQYIPFLQVDVRNTPALTKFVEQYPIDSVIHCAGFKSVQESALKPIEYYNNNLSALMSVVRMMQRIGCRQFIHVSSLMVYAQSGSQLTEQTALNHDYINPYIQSQQMMERILADVFQHDNEWNIAVLRMGNVAGAFEQGFWGEFIPKLPKSIVGLLMQIANHERESIEIYTTQDTQDRSPERSFVHILDVCDALEKTLTWLVPQHHRYEVLNISRPDVISMNQLLDTTEKLIQSRITKITSSTDLHLPLLDQVGADVSKAKQQLGWVATRTVEQMLKDQWRFYRGA
ncbi:SDR family NAD(P)-dependent oxidoreductase [Acinetobacter sp. ME22]|uniref:SDR family NAD(P)-dependent oxidoreductase n=1 Tax=Acinetobacter sp. ME22 TaxID=2904802 RepID=UPI001EDB436A|nr:SDR family NAD(P)-dependent oxidoreductase [Acinetobacter sp. ME22]MCG2572751.1 SDR family NAD(P)-dependent oxidoreductase [Acinetobacter sp. ME22]